MPQLPTHLTDWGGSATRINNDINNGASMILHRDHGAENGWSSPSYTTGNLSGLNNDDLTFFFSINCLTGKFNYGSECFAEALHRYPKRALGVIAATEVSYSFVNDAYVWGMWDGMWPDFDPGYGVIGPENAMPGFANAYGKYYLQASSWPYNPGDKTYRVLFVPSLWRCLHNDLHRYTAKSDCSSRSGNSKRSNPIQHNSE
ncbi:MAG: C25 family cysteine peptidase [Ignavibacteriaceae bacterium]|nr:C25 family cysteine peptidase [Ignavibacteriaceae bacterium]